jgi:hypothetical protein
MEICDIYKFIHQAALGSEHAVKDTVYVRKWMKEEIAGLDSAICDNMFDRLSPDGMLVRVNLRSYLKSGKSADLLLNSFIKTANEYKGSINKLRIYWKEVVKLAAEKKINFAPWELKKYFRKMENQNFPAVHHSKKYEKLYKPAYRVIWKEYLY